ncbi:brain-specific angiogenesis inhibitor 1-associated protein 2-like protein 1b isoform X2 [Triplophysa rosa]|uniref:brain-specific angiogenesis inhibitor 1-associated protein 2-like protein 1b isoform X2 n=1 Tax=Triplophysa rosa TaxID=992332 RepID=UPI002545F034|nr:brain-specific angiogenesis inhibitor 1-associated protein 2-like protein 1b isoform X2 [Triplophysa rosa]
MSRDPEEVTKLTESTYKNVMEQFNPGLRNLVNLGKSYEKAVSAMALAGKQYFDAVSKIGENAAVSPVSRELGVVLMEISDVHRKVNLELEENFKRFHREVIAELEKKTDMDVKYMTATFKRYQTEHRMKQDSLERSQSDLKKLRRKSQGKNASKYESKENECIETLTHRQMDMQKFIADGCREALLEEKRRFCFLVDKHCNFSNQLGGFHDKAREILMENINSWQDKCTDASNVPESIMSMIEGLRTPVSITPQASPALPRHSRINSEAMIPPPAPPQTSPLANMFNQDTRQQRESDYNNEDNGLSRSVSMATGLNHVDKRPKVRTIFPHKSGNNDTLLSFEESDIITLLIPEERDGWLYGELQKNKLRGWFPSSYCRAYTEPAVNNSFASNPPMRSKSVVNLIQQNTDDDMMALPPADYSDSPVRRNSTKSLNQTYTAAYEKPVSQSNGLPKHPVLGGGNPFATVKLRPTVTNDRSAPNI